MHGGTYALLLICFMGTLGCTADLRNDDEMVGKIISGFEGEPVVPRNANRLYIAPPVNGTGVPDLPERLLFKMKAHISLDGRLGVDPNDHNADLRLEVRISKFMIESLSYDGIGRAVTKRIWVTADVRLLNLKQKKVIFTENDVQAFRIFSDMVPPIVTVSQATDYVLDDLSKRLTSKTVTGWYTDQMTPLEKRKP